MIYLRRILVPSFFALVCVAGVMGNARAQSFSLLTNGNFETGNLNGWTVANIRDTGTTNPTGTTGGFFADAPGTTTPGVGVNNITFNTASNASGGNGYAVSSSDFPGQSALLQNFVIPDLANLQVTLTYQMFVTDQSGFGGVVDSSGLDYTTSNSNPRRSNQHARVDILSSSSANFTTMPGDVVRNLYSGVDSAVTHPNTNPYVSYSFNITQNVARGQTYRLRFAEVDNLSALNMGIDNVFITAVVVPEPASLALVTATLALLVLPITRRNKGN